MKLKISCFQSAEEAKLWYILPGGKILSLSRMRAEARSLMIYWRRMCLNTEQKDEPSSVFKKGFFSHKSVEQSQCKQTNKRI